MTMTEFQILFRDTLYKITDDIFEINAEYKFARTDEIRQEIIDGVLSGKIKNMNGVERITVKCSPLYKAGLITDDFIVENFGDGSEDSEE